MAKIQPNFSWQKYVGQEKDEKQQFQYQLQTQFIQISNSINSTIDDLSYFTTERQTSFPWVNGTPIFTQTVATQAWAGGTVNTIPLAIVGNFTVIDMVCCISNGTTAASTTLLLPNLDVTTAANNISIKRVGTNVILTSGGTNYSSYSGYVTVY